MMHASIHGRGCGHALLAALALLATTSRGEAIDCFPSCPPEVPRAVPRAESTDPCGNAFVDALDQADDKLKPARRIYGAVVNPAGFVFEEVNERVLHLPSWTGYLLDPQGALRAKVMDRAREEARKRVRASALCHPPVSQDDKPFIESRSFEEIAPSL